MKTILTMSTIAFGILAGNAQVVVPGHLPPPGVIVQDLRANEKPVEISQTESVVADNGLYRRVKTVFTFTNPNSRQMSADFSFPIPDEATVCAYALEVNGAMVPGVVCEKEKARVAFETEKVKSVDPGIVEHVAGNTWKTRIFPLMPSVPRKAEVEYIVPCISGDVKVVCERDGEDVFVGVVRDKDNEAAANPVASFAKGTILWDASTSAESVAAQWKKSLAALPEAGEWTLCVFRNEVEEPRRFASKADLLVAVDALAYDGGTDIGGAVASVDGPVLLFSDEIDTLGLSRPDYETRAGLVVASRPPAPGRAVEVRRLAKGEEPPAGVEVKSGTLLATAWAANRVADLAAQAEARKDEFLALGRRYGVASPVTSLIVLESLQQYLDHKIEPPATLSFHDEWVKARAAADDEIAKAENDMAHLSALLSLWKERVEWWNNPIPKKATPKSGLFDGEALEESAARAGAIAPGARARRAFSMNASAPGLAREPVDGVVMCEMAASEEVAFAFAAPDSSKAGGGGATIAIKPWNPKAAYIDAIAAAKDPYAEYLVQKKTHGGAPAFFMDAASWFLKNGKASLGRRVISNMAEFNLQDAAIWRSMGWRLREAGEYDAAIVCFRQALKLRNEEGQSRRDLALVLAERGKAAMNPVDLAEAMALLKDAAFVNWSRRSARRSNDRQVAIVALEELNALIAWCEAKGLKVETPSLDSAYRRDLPVKIRIVLSWDADETDIDLHVMEPDGEEAFYGHRRTSAGGFVSEDVTTGYGPEEYLRKEGRGKFKILTNYYASHQTALTGAVTATATVYTDWGTAAEKREIITLRLDKPKDKHLVGEVEIGSPEP